MLKSMNRYVWVAVVTVFMFILSPRRSHDPLGALVLALASGGIVFLIVLAIDLVFKPLRARAERAKYSELLLAAAEGDVTRIGELLRTGVEVDQRGPNGETSLMLAARNGHLRTVELLLEHGANSGIATPKGSTAASLAERFNHQPIIDLLSRQ